MYLPVIWIHLTMEVIAVEKFFRTCLIIGAVGGFVLGGAMVFKVIKAPGRHSMARETPVPAPTSIYFSKVEQDDKAKAESDKTNQGDDSKESPLAGFQAQP